MFKIMVVEDDFVISMSIQKFLQNKGYTVYIVRHFDRVLEDFQEFLPDLVLMDVGIPFKNGFSRLVEIRSMSNIPVIFISSSEDDVKIVTAMQLGADDYLVKPFSMDVLFVKIEAVFRRLSHIPLQTKTLQFAGATLFLDNMVISYQNKQVELTKNEFKILECLMSKKGAVVSREQLMVQLWHSDLFIDDNTLTVNVGRLRKKLQEIHMGEYIRTKKGRGYYVRSPEEH